MPEHTVPTDIEWTRAAPEDATGPGPWIEVAFGPDDHVYLRGTSDPANIVTTTRRKWDAFVLGVQAGEFDHFVAEFEACGTAGRAGPAGEMAEWERAGGSGEPTARPRHSGRRAST